MTELPPLPAYDVGIHGQVQFAFSAEALRAYAEEAIKQEREACRAAVIDEHVYAETDGDESYNMALRHAAEAIRARSYAPTDTPVER